tara:strand:- start:602 stop:1078 length:477 start_codon:yes stop_codon:yes gene_type:complete
MNLNQHQRSGKCMDMKAKKIQATPPPNVNQIITNLSYEITLLNYKNYPIKTTDQNQRRCTQYFRSHSDKRLIGAFVTLVTFKNKWITQKQILDKFPNLKKAFVSLLFKHCIDEKWFISKPTELSPNIHCYQVSDMMLNSAKDYYTFCSSSRNELEFIF